MVNTPIPHSLKSEAKKAAKILREFSIPNAKTGPDKLIPAGIFAKAKGVAILTVFKAGFLVSARGGSGIVIAKCADTFDYASGWSAPSAIALAGLGGGFEIGMEVTDFVIILNSQAAVDAFSKGGNLTLGGNFTIAAGPLGRNIEGDIAVRSPAAIYTYSKTKGIFAGISVEGSALIERKDANRKFYKKELRAFQILSGEVDPPEECQALYAVMKEHQELAARAALELAKSQALKHRDKAEEKVASEASARYGISFSNWRSKSTKSKPQSSLRSQPSRSQSAWALSEASHTSSSPPSPLMSSSQSPSSSKKKGKGSWAAQSCRASHSGNKSSRRLSMPVSDDPWAALDKASSERDDDDGGGGLWVIADHSFKGQLTCDLPFQAGDRIRVVTRTRNQQDWWEGVNRTGRQGIFPANFVHIAT